MTVAHFADNDQDYLGWIENNPNGFVVNILKGLNPTTARLHTASCRTISGKPARGGPWTGPYVKICSNSLAALETWCLEKAGSEIDRCKTCHPECRASKKVRTVATKASPGLVFEIETDPRMRSVDIWTERRLQFNSKPETVALKSAIGDAVSKLHPNSGEILNAVFTSASADLVDAENVLFYNVGTGRFAEAAEEGLRFERVHSAPSRHQHHHRYEFVPRLSPSEHWQRGQTLVTFSANIPAMHELSKPDQIWLAVRQRAATTPQHEGFYGLQVTLTTPRPVRLPTLLKPLLDGIISGLHAHNGADLELLSGRLALRLGLPSGEVAQLLSEPHQAVLGVRPLLRKFGDSLHWNPADDECVTCTLLNSVVPQASAWMLDFELFAVAPICR